MINKLRAQHGAAPLELDDDLTAKAQATAERNAVDLAYNSNARATSVEYSESHEKLLDTSEDYHAEWPK